MRGFVLFLASAIAFAASTAACDGCGRTTTTTTTTSTTTPTSSIAISASSSAPTSLPPLTRPPCRVLGPTPPGTPSTLADFMWLEVPAASRITAKDPRSARETGFEGPVRIRICVEGEEESWVVPTSAAGSFISVRGAGEAPGAEEWVVTPLGVVRYSAAMVKVTVTASSATIELTSGTVDVWAAADAVTKAKPPGDAGAGALARDAAAPSRDDEGWQRYDGTVGATVTATASLLTEAAAKASVDRCTRAGAIARALAVAISDPNAALGTLASQHVVARRLARASCAVARVRTSQLADSPSAVALAKAAVDADTVWRKVGE